MLSYLWEDFLFSGDAGTRGVVRNYGVSLKSDDRGGRRGSLPLLG